MSIFLSNFQSIVRAWNLQMQKNKNIGLTHPKQNTAQKQSPTKHLLLCTSLWVDDGFHFEKNENE